VLNWQGEADCSILIAIQAAFEKASYRYKQQTKEGAQSCWFARYGQPNVVITDNGPQFVSLQFKKFAAGWEFDHITSSPHQPQANGKAESAVKIVKNLCRKALDESRDPWKAILHWSNTPTEGMDSSPAQRLMSRRLKTSLPMANKLLEPMVIQGVPERLQEKRQVAKAKYDESARGLPEL
ncbi:hypothetical protein E2320_001389, partial [Naja naja]